jgi:hypothetical protein
LSFKELKLTENKRVIISRFPELDKLETRTQLPLFSDFGKRSAMDLDDEPKAKEVKVIMHTHTRAHLLPTLYAFAHDIYHL